MHIVEFHKVSRTFGSEETPVPVLREVSLACDAAETVAIMGKSGSGKSTLLHLVAGIDVPTRGEVRVNGQNLADLDDEARTLLRRRFIGLIFQAFHLLPNLSAEQNVALPLILDGKPRRHAAAESAALLDMVGLSHRRTHLPSQMSGGEQQRVAIARALIMNPRLLLADEPTGNLDSQNGAAVMTLLYNLVRERGMTLILVTHDPSVAQGAQRQVHLCDGRIESDVHLVSKAQ